MQSQLGSFPRNLKQDIFFPRLDYQLNQKNHLSRQFLWEDFHQPNGYNSSATVNNGSVTQNGTANFHERILIANAEPQLTANAANVVHFQWSRDLETDSTNSAGPAISHRQLNRRSTSIWRDLRSAARSQVPRRASLAGHRRLHHLDGKHTLKFGVDLNFIHEQIANLFQGDGSFTYSNSAPPNADFTNFVQDSYNVNPTLTAGRHTVSAATTTRSQQTDDPMTGVGADDFWNKNLDVFVEDDWKVTPKLLLIGRPPLRRPARSAPGHAQHRQRPVAFNATSSDQSRTAHDAAAPRLLLGSPYAGTVVRGG